MAPDPFEHVMDTRHWHIFETQGWVVHLPKIGDFSISKFMVLQVLAAVLICLCYIPLARRARTGEPPRGWFGNMLESVLTFLREQVAKPNLGEHDADRYVPFLWTLFLYVLVLNLLGMLPFFGAATASITVTGILAVFAFLAIHLGAVAKMGLVPYLKSYVPPVDAPLPMKLFVLALMIPIEVIGAFIKAFVLAVRLFANMFAGHTVAAVILGFIVMAANSAAFWPVTIGSIVMVTLLSCLELFVAFLQAFIFVFLTSLFIGSALHPAH